MKNRKILLGIAVSLFIIGIIFTSLPFLLQDKHAFYCDKFMLTVDEKQIDLSEVVPELSSVSELLLMDKDHLFIMGRIDAEKNALMIYDFVSEEIIFNEAGSMLCFTDNDYRTARFLKDDIVYDLSGNIIYKAPKDCHIYIIEYVKNDLKITITDLQYENEKEVWL